MYPSSLEYISGDVEDTRHRKIGAQFLVAAEDEEKEEVEEERAGGRLKIVALIKSVRNGARFSAKVNSSADLLSPRSSPTTSPYFLGLASKILRRNGRFLRRGVGRTLCFYESTYPRRFAPPITKHPVYTLYTLVKRRYPVEAGRNRVENWVLAYEQQHSGGGGGNGEIPAARNDQEERGWKL